MTLGDPIATVSAVSSRRCAKATALGLACLAALVVLSSCASPFSSDPALKSLCGTRVSDAQAIAAENECAGTSSWEPDKPIATNHEIEAYASPVSINAGENVHFYISTTAPVYQFAVYRLGWYQGLGARLVYTSSKWYGAVQPAPTVDPKTHTVRCNWVNPFTLQTGHSWVSGVYVAKLVASTGYINYTSFVLRNDASTAPILFQTSDLTYQAYNNWGGYSLYRGLDAHGASTALMRSYIVSFDRPYASFAGLGDFALYELNLLRWMERQGYPMTYTTDIDTDMHGDRLLHHTLFVAAGHDEYWSTAMRDSVLAARDKGVSLAFFGANDVYWHVRLQPSPLGPDREVVCYKAGYATGDTAVDPMAKTTPAEATVRWRDPPLSKPESELLGQEYGGAPTQAVPLVLDKGASQFLAGSGLAVGMSLPSLVGGEYDRLATTNPAPKGLLILATSPLKCIVTTLCPQSGNDASNAVVYTAASGARVFDAGTFQWSWGLDDEMLGLVHRNAASSPGFQTFTANILTYLLQAKPTAA